VRITVNAPGGHSSIPPTHTSIGMLSRMLVEYEANPFEAHVHREAVNFASLQCLGKHAPQMPAGLRKAIAESPHSDMALKRVEELLFQDPLYRTLFSTTQAIDLIQGGVKANALPESANAVMNHRIDSLSTLKTVIDRDTRLVKPLAEAFNLSFTAFGTCVFPEGKPANGHLELNDAWGYALEPAPITPIDGAPYKLLSGTIIAAYKAQTDNDTIVVSPAVMSGNTDTRYYWNLSDHIFRYSHLSDDKNTGQHTVNEKVNVDDLLGEIRFFTTLVLNADKADI
jgi:Gly-Xaa carboxypeptidase